MQPKQTLVLTLAALVVLGVLAYMFFTRPAQGPVSPTASSTTVTLEDGTVVTLPPGATIEETEVPNPSAIAAPNYRAALKIDASVSTDVRQALEAQHKETIRILNADPLNFSIWVNLGMLRKIAGDYRGAEEIWVYTSKQWPTSPVSFHNLTDLYQNFLKEPAKAQAAAEKAAALEASASQ